jgi:hypothetical protein
MTVDRLSAQRSTLSPTELSTDELRQLVDRQETECTALRQQLQQLKDENEKLKHERSLLLHALCELQVSDEELDRARREEGGASLAEIFEKLEGSCGSR